jgi:hypothetical protein
MEPTSSPDNTRPSPGLARFWQVRPDADIPAAYPAAETPADLLPSSPLPPVTAARQPEKPAPDPFGLSRAAGRATAGTSRPPARSRHGDTDHSVPPDEETDSAQDVKSQEPEAGRETTFGGFGLGSRLGGTGRFLFGGRAATDSEDVNGRSGDEDTPAEPGSAAPEAEAASAAPEAEVTDDAEPGDAAVADQPGGEQSSGATPAEDPAEETPREADDQDAAEQAGPSDENGREDMNGRAGAPGYAQAGEAPGPDGDDESPAQVPAEPARPAAGWAQVPTSMVPPTSAPPVSGVPVSPGFPPPAYGNADFTPDHPAGATAPVSGPRQPETPEPAGPAATAPVSPAQIPGVQAPGVPLPPVQIPATRTPPDLAVDRGPEATESGSFGFGPTGYSLGRSGEAYGVASVAPASPPPDYQSLPPVPVEAGVTGLAVGGAGRRAREEEHEDVAPHSTPRRSASLEDVEPVRRAGRRAAMPDEEALPAMPDQLGGEELPVTRTIWDEDAARHFRAAWHEVKAEFVDDPVTALTRAHDLLTDAVNELTEVLLAERDELDPLRGTETPDTESMRMAMRGYREYLDRILSL